MCLGGVCGVERWCFEDLLWDVHNRCAAQDVVLFRVSASYSRTFTPNTYPASVWIEESPVHSICQDVFHLPTPVQEDSQHALSELYYSSIFLCFCWLRGIVGHCMLLWYWGNDQRRVEVDQRCAQGSKFRISALDFKTLLSYEFRPIVPRLVRTPQLMVYCMKFTPSLPAFVIRMI